MEIKTSQPIVMNRILLCRRRRRFVLGRPAGRLHGPPTAERTMFLVQQSKDDDEEFSLGWIFIEPIASKDIGAEERLCSHSSWMLRRASPVQFGTVGSDGERRPHSLTNPSQKRSRIEVPKAPRSNQLISSLRPHLPSLFVFSSIEISTDTTTSAAPTKETSGRTCASIGWDLSDWNLSSSIRRPVEATHPVAIGDRTNSSIDSDHRGKASTSACMHFNRGHIPSPHGHKERRHVAAKRGGRFFAERILRTDPSLVSRRKHRMGSGPLLTGGMDVSMKTDVSSATSTCLGQSIGEGFPLPSPVAIE